MRRRLQTAATEKLCFAFNTDKNGICWAKGGSVIFYEDTVYERKDLKGIVLKETQIKCKTKTMDPCILTIRLSLGNNDTYFEMYDGSMIHAKRVFFDSPSTRLTIDNTSLIEVNGRSTSTKGTASGVQGASYLGQGGYCGAAEYQEKFYGQFYMEPISTNMYDMNFDTMEGSIGTIGDLATGGGGRIHIDVDSLNLTGRGQQIQANGLPLEANDTGEITQNAGSGGYIWINTRNKFFKNNID